MIEPILLQTHGDAAANEFFPIRCHPDGHGAVAFAHHSVHRKRDAVGRLAGLNEESGHHSRPHPMLRIANLGAHHRRVGAGIQGFADGLDAPLEFLTVERREGDRHRLSDAQQRDLALGNIGQHPKRAEIGDRVRRGRIAGLNQEARLRKPRGDATGDGAGNDQRGVHFALGDHSGDIAVVFAEDAHGIASGLQRALGAHVVGDGLLIVLLRHAFVGIQVLRARQGRRGEICLARSGDERRLRLKQVGAVDGVQRPTPRHVVADVGEGLDDAPRVGREHLHRGVLIEVDGTHRGMLHLEASSLDGREFQCAQLRGVEHNAVIGGRRRSGRRCIDVPRATHAAE